MDNPIVESELQDICSFRKSIIESFQKIQNKISKTKTPLKLNSSCNCNQENPLLNPFDICSFEDKTTNYFTQKDNFWSSRKSHRQKVQKNDRLIKYLNEYDLNNFNFDVQPLRQRKAFDNQQNLFRSQTPLKNNKLSEKLNSSAFQITSIPFSNENITVVKNQRRNFSNHENYNKIVYDEIQKEKVPETRSKSEIKWRNEHKENILTSRNKASPQKTVSKVQSLIETSKRKAIKSREVSTKGFVSNRQVSNSKPKLSVKQHMKEEIYKRIKNRIYLSCVVYKSSQDCFSATYQKEIKQREDILNKIVNNSNVIKKFGKVIHIA